MVDKEKIVNQNVSIKIAGVEHPQIVNIKDWTDAGIWVQSDSLHAELVRLAGEKGIPGFLERNPLIFITHHRLEWLMAAAKTVLQ